MFDPADPSLSITLCAAMSYDEPFSKFCDEALMEDVVDYILRGRNLLLPDGFAQAFELDVHTLDAPE